MKITRALAVVGLAGASVGYNALEAVIAITAGVVAGSVALVGFGLDSVVEVSSGLIILWQFRHRLPESREKQALLEAASLKDRADILVAITEIELAKAGSGSDTPLQ